MEGTNISLWDTWGVTAENYKAEEFKRLLAGQLPKLYGQSGVGQARSCHIRRFEMNTKQTESSTGKRPAEKRLADKIHAVIFVVSAMEVVPRDDDDETQKKENSKLFRLRQFITEASRAGHYSKPTITDSY